MTKEKLPYTSSEIIGEEQAFHQLMGIWGPEALMQDQQTAHYPLAPVIYQMDNSIASQLQKGRRFNVPLSYSVDGRYTGYKIEVVINTRRVADLRDHYFKELKKKAGQNPRADYLSEFISEQEGRYHADLNNYGLLTVVRSVDGGQTNMVLPDPRIERLARVASNSPTIPNSPYGPFESLLRRYSQNIGVLGASVGGEIAQRIAQSMGRKIIVADPKDMHATALNRAYDMRYLGANANKAIAAAMNIHANNPLLSVGVCPDGITFQNVGNFMGDIDFAVEEIDTVVPGSGGDLVDKLAIWKMFRERGLDFYTAHDIAGVTVVERHKPSDPTLAFGYEDREIDEAMRKGDFMNLAQLVVGRENIILGMGHIYQAPDALAYFPGALKQPSPTIGIASGLVATSIEQDLLGVPQEWSRKVIDTHRNTHTLYDNRGNIIHS